MRIEPFFEWPAPGATRMPARRVVAKVWRVALDIDSAELDRAYGLLASDEKARAARFAFAVHRRRFIAARAALREILGEQLSVAPRDLEFGYTAEGKPVLGEHPDQHFSVTHSGALCMIAMSCGPRLGIDLEATVSNRVQLDEIARSLHPAERQALAALDPARKEEAFYRCWVRKEALLKALGVGLGGGLDRFHVSVDDKARLIWSDPALAAATDWTLVALDGAGYAAALAIECGFMLEAVGDVVSTSRTMSPCKESLRASPTTCLTSPPRG